MTPAVLRLVHLVRYGNILRELGISRRRGQRQQPWPGGYSSAPATTTRRPSPVGPRDPHNLMEVVRDEGVPACDVSWGWLVQRNTLTAEDRLMLSRSPERFWRTYRRSSRPSHPEVVQPEIVQPKVVEPEMVHAEVVQAERSVVRPSRTSQLAGAASVVSALLLLGVVPSAHALPAALVLLLSVLLLSVLLSVPLLLLLVFAIGRRARALFRPASVVPALVCSSHISVAADSTDGLQERATEGSSEVAEAIRDEDNGRECFLARCPEPVEEGSTGGTGLGAAATVDCGRTTPPVALFEAASASREPRRSTRRHKAPTLGDMVSP